MRKSARFAAAGVVACFAPSLHGQICLELPYLESLDDGVLNPLFMPVGDACASILETQEALEVTLPLACGGATAGVELDRSLARICDQAFDLRIDLALQLDDPDQSIGDVRVRIMPDHLDDESCSIGLQATFGSYAWVANDLGTPGAVAPAAAPAGTVRITRDGEEFRMYYLEDGAWQELLHASDVSLTASVQLRVGRGVSPGSVRGSFSNLRILPPAPPAVIGACCLNGSVCVFVSDTDCALAGGSFAGAQVTCSEIVCEPGCPADEDSDQDVDVFDLLAYLDDWFEGCP